MLSSYTSHCKIYRQKFTQTACDTALVTNSHTSALVVVSYCLVGRKRYNLYVTRHEGT
jgi:hypothetical protein